MIIMRTYFQSSIPDTLHEAAVLDGCNYTRYLLRIVLPLSMPIIAVVGLYYAVGHWNMYFDALIYLRSTEKQNLQLVLRNILLANPATVRSRKAPSWALRSSTPSSSSAASR